MGLDEYQVLQNFNKTTMDFIEKLLLIINQMRKTSLEKSMMDEKIALISAIIGDGKEGLTPYLQLYDSENKQLADEVVRRMKLYQKNWNPTTDEPKLNYFIPDDISGKTVIWTNEHGIEIINKIRDQIAFERGAYHTEIKPSELAENILNNEKSSKKTVSLQLSQEMYFLMKAKELPVGNDYSFSSKTNKDTVEVTVQEESLCQLTLLKNDMLTDLVRAQLSLSNNSNTILEEIAYERNLCERMLSYNGKTPTYITSAINGGECIKITKDGFCAYRIGMDGNNIRQVPIGKEVKRTELETAEYEKLLYRQIKSLQKPVEINERVYAKNERLLDKYTQRDKKLAYEVAAKQIIRKAINKGEKFLESNTYSAPDVSDHTKLIEYYAAQERNTYVTELATRQIFVAYDKGTTPNPLEKEDGHEIREYFYLEQFQYVNPVLYGKFREEMEKSEAYRSVLRVLAQKEINSRTKDELRASLGNLYNEVITTMPDRALAQKIERAAAEFTADMIRKGNAIIKEYNTKSLKEAFDRTKAIKPNRAFDVVLTSCTTGRVLEGIRPLNNTDTNSMYENHLKDTMTKEFVKLLKKNISKAYPDGYVSPEFFQSALYSKMVKKTKNQLEKAAEKHELGKISPELYSYYIKFNEYGISASQTWDDIAKCACRVFDTTITIDTITLEKAAKLREMEKGSQEWTYLDYENDSEKLNVMMLGGIQNENISFNQDTHSMQTKKEQRKSRTEDINI